MRTAICASNKTFVLRRLVVQLAFESRSHNGGVGSHKGDNGLAGVQSEMRPSQTAIQR